MTPSVVWLKRDLRIDDHEPICRAAERGPVIILYVYEPSLLRSPEFDPQHLRFINESLVDLANGLARRGGRLITRQGEVVEVLEALRLETGFRHLWSHEETGNNLTFQRDKAVARWARSVGVEWTELPQTGVVRRLRDRDGWSRLWEARMAAPIPVTPQWIPTPESVASCGILGPAALGLQPDPRGGGQPGGMSAARETLHGFLTARGLSYAKGLSSPVTAPDACSRLSAHLAFGCLSMRQIWQATQQQRECLRSSREPVEKAWWGSLKAFEARLHWHCHFMQKLESQPSLEFENLHRACDGLREDEFSEAHFAAWCEGRTGYPMVDACMRSLQATGWLNFRMRAMLVSFAAYDLWLHWRRPAVFLARHFLDFEPGIHFSQFQMQSGTTGINTLRVYSPTKQAKDHDPDGTFIRRWVPELEGVPTKLLFEPWLLSTTDQHRFGCVIGRDYPAPVVDHNLATKAAKDRLYALRRQAEAREESRRIVREHGSRKRSGKRARKSPAPNQSPQADLFAEVMEPD
jgi:deoxyribodipyrimidine photo-lyase